jgi:hypothetical protein
MTAAPAQPATGHAAMPKIFTNYDALKLFALLAMTLDHLGVYLFPEMLELRVIGRAAAPIFCFLVGWNCSYRWRFSLLLAALMVSGFSFLHGALFPLNILWGILIGRLLMDWLDRRAHAQSAWFMVLAACVWLPLLGFVFDYASACLLWMLWGRQQRRHPNSAASYIYAIGAFVGAASLIQIFSNFPLPYMVAAMAVLALTMLGLQRFRLREYPMLRLPLLMALSRHALMYYVLHLAMIMGAALALGITPLGLRFF